MTDIAGNEITERYQYEFNGWLFGANTNTRVESMRGLRGLPPVRLSNRSKPNRHGSFPGAAYYEERRIQWDMWMTADAHGVDAVMDELGACFQLTEAEVPFVWYRPGGDKRRLDCKVTGFDVTTDYQYGQGIGSASVELTASNPVHYSNQLREKSFEVIAGESSNSITINNRGKIPSDSLVLVVRGPLSAGASIVNSTDSSRQLKLLNELESGEVLVIDCYRREATFYADYGSYLTGTDGVDSYNFSRVDSEWFSVLPGDNSIVLNRDATTGTAQLEIFWRDAWIM